MQDLFDQPTGSGSTSRCAYPHPGVDVAPRSARAHRSPTLIRRVTDVLRASKARPEARPTCPPAPNRRARSGVRIPVVTVRSCNDACRRKACQCRELSRTSLTRHDDRGQFRASRSTVTPPGTTGPSSIGARTRHPRHATSLTQHRAVRQNYGERRIVADRAEIAEVIGDPFHLRQQRPQPDGARRRHSMPQRRLDRAGEPDAERHRAVARYPAGESGRLLLTPGRQTVHRRLCGHSQAVASRRTTVSPSTGETEMPGFDDAGVNRANGNLM